MSGKIFQGKIKIVGKQNLGSGYFKLSLLSPKISSLALPGQFVEIKISDSDEPLLRRPFSIHRAKGKKIEILYEVLGCGTKALSRKKAGGFLDIIGPLGQGFSFKPGIGSKRLAILVAGGMGVAPLMFLAQKLTRREILVLIGARTKEQISCEKEFKKLGCGVKIATDDGSRGFKGKVTELLKGILRDNEMLIQQAEIYSCGPRPMLKEISRISQGLNIPAQISLEEHMACGIGACLGCVVDTKAGLKRVCKEGPVFAAEKIVWKK